MAKAIPVSDSLSNAPEQIEYAAKAIGRSIARQQVFKEIYHHKSKAKSVGHIAERTGLTRMRVLQEGKHLVHKGIVSQTKKGGETAYETIGFFRAHKKQILRLVKDPRKLDEWPTKRKIQVKLPGSVTISTAGAKVKRITIDDVGSFAKAKNIKDAGSLPGTMTEDQFKRGVQSIIGEPGEFKDWGGEKSDLYSTRLWITGKRRAAAFAFKGPGIRGKLVPARMGKNGDQAQRLFQEPAEVYLVQHWREIDPSVIELMQSLAVAKSVTTGRKVWYGVIDGKDSERLRLAYPSAFEKLG